MKKLIYIPVMAFLLAAGNAFSANDWPQEHLGLPGDNLNLFAVMNLFQESETLEAFERALNDPERMINNLDLTGNNYVDYIMVFDYVDGDIHNIVLRVAINEHEYQDVAVFVVQRFADGSVQIQLIGDEALYGPNYIIEPNYAERPNPGYRGNVVEQRNVQNVTVVRTTYHEVAHWPVIVYMSRPIYRPWRSAWHWGYFPSYWHPWNPHYWHFYYGYHYHWHAHYYMHFRPWWYLRCGGRFRTVYYANIRHYSPTVIVNVNTGRFRNTYSQPEQLSQGKALYSQRNPNGRIRTAEHNPALMHGDIIEAKRRVQPVLQGENHGSAGGSQTLQSRPETQNNAIRSAQAPARGQQQRPGVESSRQPERPAVQGSRQQQQQQPRQVTAPQRETRSVAPASQNRQPREQRVSTPPARQTQPAPAQNVRSTPPQRSTPSSGRSPSVSSGNRSSGSSPAVQRSSGSSSRQQPASVGSSSSRSNRQPATARPASRNQSSGSSATPARSQSRSNESTTSRPQRR